MVTCDEHCPALRDQVCAIEGVSLLAYSPLAMGLLTVGPAGWASSNKAADHEPNHYEIMTGQLILSLSLMERSAIMKL